MIFNTPEELADNSLENIVLENIVGGAGKKEGPRPRPGLDKKSKPTKDEEKPGPTMSE